MYGSCKSLYSRQLAFWLSSITTYALRTRSFMKLPMTTTVRAPVTHRAGNGSNILGSHRVWKSNALQWDEDDIRWSGHRPARHVLAYLGNIRHTLSLCLNIHCRCGTASQWDSVFSFQKHAGRCFPREDQINHGICGRRNPTRHQDIRRDCQAWTRSHPGRIN